MTKYSIANIVPKPKPEPKCNTVEKAALEAMSVGSGAPVQKLPQILQLGQSGVRKGMRTLCVCCMRAAGVVGLQKPCSLTVHADLLSMNVKSMASAQRAKAWMRISPF